MIYDSNGNALVLWQQLDGTSYHIYYSWLTAAATAWSAPVRLDTTVGNAGSSQLAADAHGNVVALWTQTDSAQTDAIYHVWSSVYMSSTAAWSPPAVVGNDPTLHAIFPSVACNADGTAEALWVLFDGSIWSNQYAPTAGWGSAKLVEAGGNGNQAPRMAIDPSGNVMAIWERTDPNTPTSHIRYAALPAGGGSWSVSAQVSAIDAGAYENTEVPQIAFDAQGEALAIWSRFADGHEMRVRPSTHLEQAGAHRWMLAIPRTSIPALAVAPNGNAVAAWQQISNGVSNLWVNIFD